MNAEQLKAIHDANLLSLARETMARDQQTFAPLHVMLDYESMWAILSAIQLGLRHPHNVNPEAYGIARVFAWELAKRIGTDEFTREIIRRGWEAK